MKTSYLLKKEVCRKAFGLFALAMAFSFTACSNDDSPEDADEPKEIPVERIEIPQAEVEIGQNGEEQSFDIHFSPVGAKVKNLTAESSNTEIATVTAKLYNKADKDKEKAQLSRATSTDGYDSAEITITPLADGEVTITLTADGVTSTFKATVKMPKTYIIQTGEMKEIGYNRAIATIDLNLEKLPFKLEELEEGKADVGIIFSSIHKQEELDNSRYEDYGLWHYSSKDGDLESNIQEVELGDNMALKSGTTYYYRAYIMYFTNPETIYYGDIKQFTTLTEKEISTEQIVDLGLSVKWAGWNIGASKPEEIGGYYAWGETEEHEDNVFGQSAYNSALLSKYTANGKKKLEAADDVAQVKWGSKWRMPTLAEMNELKKLCNCTVVTYKDVRGYKFVGKNGNSIFIPFGGLYANSTKIEDSDGILWTSELSNVDNENDRAYLLWKNFKDPGSILPTGEIFDVRAYRWNGCTVRAVYVGD